MAPCPHVLNSSEITCIPAGHPTALLLIDCQLGFRNVSAWGTGSSNPAFEDNVKALLGAFRAAGETKPPLERPQIIHVQYRPTCKEHPLEKSKMGPWGENGETKRAIDFLEFAAPLLRRPDGTPYKLFTFDEPPPPDPAAIKEEETKQKEARPFREEMFITKHQHSVFVNTPLEQLLNDRGVKTLLIAGMTTDHAVSTAVRMAHDLALGWHWGRGDEVEGTATAEADDGCPVDMPRIVLVTDATRTFGKTGLDPETVHNVHVESLRDFSELRTTAEVLKSFA